MARPLGSRNRNTVNNSILPPKEVFEKNIKFSTETDCWIWNKGTSASGYGRYYIDGVQRYAHQYSYELYIGPIPNGLLVLHRCNNKPCVNPDHLYAGTYSNNNDDVRRTGGGYKKTNQEYCGRGHLMLTGSLYVGRDGRRQCKSCAQIRNAPRGL